MNPSVTFKDSLLVIGSGRLGLRVAKLWRQRFQTSTILCETRSQDKHLEIKNIPAQARLNIDADPSEKYNNLLFCVPPVLDVAEYSRLMKRALSLWSGAGQCLFTSSTSVYLEEKGDIVREESLIDTEGVRAQPLLAAEAIALGSRGNVVRLAGLYDENSGPHLLYIKSVLVDLRPDAWVNLIHLDDAAAVCMKVLTSNFKKSIFLISDGTPTRRKDILKEVLKIKDRLPLEEFAGPNGCDFRLSTGPMGKRVDPSQSWGKLKIKANYSSFKDWVQKKLHS